MSKKKYTTVMALLVVTVVSYFTAFRNYDKPQAVFWDENYHIASAQKYLNGVYFMELHPPLGKLLIAAGEKIIHANPADNQFLKTDYATGFASDFSFRGYRLIPALLGWFCVPLLFLIFSAITGSALLSSALTVPFLFQNAIIVHFRSAMLDSTLIFFMLLAILAVVSIFRSSRQKVSRKWLVLLGFALGALAATKVLGLIALGFVFPLIVAVKPIRLHWIRATCTVFGTAVFVWLSVWQIHVGLAQNIEPALQSDGYYMARQDTRENLNKNQRFGPRVLYHHIRDALAYSSNYNKGVPRLDLCKPDENGSPAWLWPFGGRSINYRWEKPGDGTTKYLFLQVNPVAWWLSGLAALFALFRIFSAKNWRSSKDRVFVATLLVLYFGYYAVLSRIPRVMYLYHAFIPYIFGLLLLGFLTLEFSKRVKKEALWSVLLIVCTLVVGDFFYYAPLTYYRPLTDNEIQAKAFLPVFDLHCVDCAREWIFRTSCHNQN